MSAGEAARQMGVVSRGGGGGSGGGGGVSDGSAAPWTGQELGSRRAM